MSTNSENLHALEVGLEAFAKKVDIAPQVITRVIATDLHTRMSKRTPVDKGRARASWDVKEGAPSDFVPPETKGSVKGKGKTKLGTGVDGSKLGSGASTGGKIKDVSSGIAGITGTAPVFITSALDYMKYLEDGSSDQAPAGMVRLSLAEVEVELENILEQLP